MGLPNPKTLNRAQRVTNKTPICLSEIVTLPLSAFSRIDLPSGELTRSAGWIKDLQSLIVNPKASIVIC